MRMRFVKQAAVAGGYLLYTLAVLCFLLWYLFPAQQIKQRVEFELNTKTPALHWKIERIALDFPGVVRLHGVQLTSGKGTGEVVWPVDMIQLKPDLSLYLRRRRISSHYRVEMLDGVVEGNFKLAGNLQVSQYDGTITGLDIKKIKLLRQFERTATGVLSATFQGQGPVQSFPSMELAGDLSVSQGMFSLLEPVLGMKQLYYKKISSHFKLQQGVLHITRGVLAAPLLAGNFSGTLTLAEQIKSAQLNLSGELVPRPELLRNQGETLDVQLVKRQLKDGKLPFTVRGDLNRPGLFFRGVSSKMNRHKPGRRQ